MLKPICRVKRTPRVNFLSWRNFASTADKACAFTLRVTTCNDTVGGTSDEDITFQFCEGGSYCTEDDTEDNVVGLPSGVGLDVSGATVQITVSSGYEPTTAKLIKGDNNFDAW